jgi:GNAT superfamily N-acetyltransferase
VAKLRTTVTYLEMTDPSELQGSAPDDPRAQLVEVHNCTVSFYRFLYNGVGEQYHWVERRRWSDGRLAAHLADPRVRIWLLLFEGCPAGYVELFRDDEGGVEIAYFGLLPEFLGKGLGKRLLTAAVEIAWSLDPRPSRVWLHTCDLDAPQALPNYVARGFRPYKTDEEVIETIDE